MKAEDQIDGLLEKVDKLSHDIRQCHEEIDLLKNELAKIKSTTALPKTSKEKTAVILESSGLENFIGLKLIHFIGIIVLIIGLTIAVKYAVDANLISASTRIILAYISAVVLFFISIRLKNKYTVLSAVFFSGAMASVYFTSYAAFAYYDMLSRTSAFIIMLGLTLLTVYNALKYNKHEIAILGLVGAYGIPFFVKGNTDNIAGLLLYILLINVGILFLSLKKYWLSLTYLSFFTTWLIFFVHLYFIYDTAFHNTEIIFACIFFCLFIVNSLGFKLFKQLPVSTFDNFIFICNTLFLYFSLILLFRDPQAVEMITLLCSVLYSGIAIIIKKYSEKQKQLADVFFAIGLVSLFFYIFLHFNGLTTTMIWGTLAIILFIPGMIFKLKILRVGSIFLFALTLIKLLFIDSDHFSSIERIIAYIFTGTILMIVSFLYQKFRKNIFGAP